MLKKLFLLLCALCLSYSFLLSQECVNNPSIQQGDINPAPLIAGSGGHLQFSYLESLQAYRDEENDPVSIIICLLNIEPEDGINSISGSFSSTFDWRFDAESNCIQGVQNKDIEAESGGLIKVDFKQKTSFNCPNNQMGFSVNLQPAACMNGVNQVLDDSESVYTCNHPVPSPLRLDYFKDRAEKPKVTPSKI